MSEASLKSSDMATSATLFERKPAGFWVRFFAYLVDLLIINIVIVGLVVHTIISASGLEHHTIFYLSWSTIIGFIMFYVYFVVMTKFLGQTLGKMIFGLRVVSDNDSALSWSTVVFREAIGRLFSAIILVPYLIVGFTNKHKGLHDLIADTHVIHENNYSPKTIERSDFHEKSMKERYEKKEKQENEPSQLQDKENL